MSKTDLDRRKRDIGDCYKNRTTRTLFAIANLIIAKQHLLLRSVQDVR
jgi:hypothetical protein